MSLVVTLTPENNGFVENPITMNVSSSSEVSYVVTANGTPVFTGSGTGNFAVNLAEMLAAVLEPLSPISGDDVLIALNKLEYTVEFVVTVTNAEQESQTVGMTAWRGGVSKLFYRQLTSSGKNIFTERFLNPSANFLFCDRGPGWEIAMKETEVYPIPFVMPSGTMQIRDMMSGNVLAINGTAGTLYALNIDALRYAFFDTYNVLTNLLSVEVDGQVVTRICISRARLAPERYLLRFASSLGNYQLMEVVGSASVSNEPETDELYQRYDSLVDDFVSQRSRVPSRRVISISTGVKTAGEVALLRDMLASDDVVLVGFDDAELPVIATADDLTYRHRPTTPESFTLKLTPVEYDRQITSDILLESYSYPRIFSDEFNENFN